MTVNGFGSVEVQRRGATVVVLLNGGRLGLSGKNAELNWKCGKVNQACPIRLVALHYCYTDEAWRAAQAHMRTSLNESEQVRMRVHHGKTKFRAHRFFKFGSPGCCLIL